MTELTKIISDEQLIAYWKTFFDEKITIDEINDKLEAISNTNLKKIIQENNNDITLIDSFVWNDIDNQECLTNIFKKLENKNFWLHFYEPILKKYMDKFIVMIKNSDIINDVDMFLTQMILAVLKQVNNIAFQTIIAEIFYAKESNLLKGDTKQERGKYFSDVLLKNNDYLKEIYTNYPELSRILDIKVNQSIEYILKIINDTSKELNNIEKYLNKGNSLGKIKTIILGEGDTHNNGTTVAKLIFDTDKIVIYKPHDLKIDKKYFNFIQWLNNKSTDKKGNLRACKVHTIEDAGWSEYIEHKACVTEKDIKNFYYKTGKLLFILHSLNGNDMHNENVIACGNNPILIDLETLIHPDINGNQLSESAVDRAYKELSDSVSSTHLLPSRVVNQKNDKVIEIGGMGGIEEQEAPFKSKEIIGYGTDEVKIVRQYGVIHPKNNNPIYDGITINSKKYVQDIISGFKTTYKWTLENKKIYLDKIQSTFNDFKIRILYRGTNVYAQLLFSSYHPDLLTNYNDRYIYLHRFAVNFKDDVKIDKIIKAEISNMMQGDIPYFSTNVNGTEVYNVDSENIESNFDSSLEKIKQKVKDMSEKKLYRQIVAINTSYMAEDDRHIHTPIKFNYEGKKKYNEHFFIEQATKIADYMLERSIIGEKKGVKSRVWLESILSPYGFSTYTCMSGNLYDGLSGVILLYHYLWKITNDNKYKKVVDEILVSISPKDIEKNQTIKIGAFNGLLGLAYALFYVDESNVYEQNIINILDILNNNMEKVKNEDKDIINGIGNLGILISIYEKTKNELIKNKALEICINIFNILKETKITIENKEGICWTKQGYVGYSHGNAGIISQLYRLYNIKENKEILDLIKEALLYEKSMYSDENKNWYRSIDDQRFTNGWCHCAPGILLSKIQLKKNGYIDETIDKDIMVAINTTIENGLNRDITLSHGDMGNMVILKDSAIVLKDKKLYNQAIATIEDISDYLLNIMQTETFKENEFNSFMVGLSGIAYEMLRIGRENEMPNILGLE